ncbi:GGDEF domain-containing protein [Candidatus Pacearchaeota archaeon]|nr:hypothetical protein [uncultured archaeon]MBS3085645.1 GGDEF domain-containing protein [Candidatus Pacearchaeota archaeon]
MPKKDYLTEKLNKKVSALDPKFREKITELFSTMHESISLLYEAAIHDEKTGLYNNKFFDTMLDIEFEKAKRGRQRLCLFVIDIDFFKKINDAYGHLMADKLLKKLAEILQRSLRKSDIIARFGGEEFFIIFPETSIEKAKFLTSRLREIIKSDKTLKKYSLTISGGLTEFKKSDTKKTLMKRADKALYKAKNSGRDRFVVLK